MKFNFLSRVAGLVILSLGILFTSYAPAQASPACKTYWLEEYPVCNYPVVWPVVDYIPKAATVCLTDTEYNNVSKAFDGLDLAQTFIRNDVLDSDQPPGSIFVSYAQDCFLKNHILYYVVVMTPGMTPVGKTSYITLEEYADLLKWFGDFYTVQQFLHGKAK